MRRAKLPVKASSNLVERDKGSSVTVVVVGAYVRILGIVSCP